MLLSRQRFNQHPGSTRWNFHICPWWEQNKLSQTKIPWWRLWTSLAQKSDLQFAQHFFRQSCMAISGDIRFLEKCDHFIQFLLLSSVILHHCFKQNLQYLHGPMRHNLSIFSFQVSPGEASLCKLWTYSKRWCSGV